MKNTTVTLTGVVSLLVAASSVYGQIQYTTDANTVALYHLNETSGSTAFDSSGSNRNATIGSAVAVGRPSQPGLGTSMKDAASLSTGRISYLDTTTTNGQQSVLYTIGQAAFTLEAWIKFDSLDFTSNAMIVAVQPFQNATYDYRLGVLGSSGPNPYALTFGTASSPNLAFTIGGLSWAVDQWYHVAVTVENTGPGASDTAIKLFRNVAGDSTTPSPIYSTTRGDLVLNSSTAQRQLEIGNYYGANGSYFFPGSVDEVRVSNIARTEFTTLAVPETSTTAMVGIGAILLFLIVRKKKAHI